MLSLHTGWYRIEQTSNLTYKIANAVFCFNANIPSNTKFASSKKIKLFSMNLMRIEKFWL